MPVIGRGNDHGVQVFAIEHSAIVAKAIGRVAFFLLDALGGLARVMIVNVGDGDDLGVGLLKERVEELAAAAAGTDQTKSNPVVGSGGRVHGRSTGEGRRAGGQADCLNKSAPRDSLSRHGLPPFNAAMPSQSLSATPASADQDDRNSRTHHSPGVTWHTFCSYHCVDALRAQG